MLYGTQYAMRGDEGAGRGSIVNVSSAAIDEPYAGIGVYAFTKAAVAMLTMTAALEAGEYGIRINVIAPGWSSPRSPPGGCTSPTARSTSRPTTTSSSSRRSKSPLHVVGEPIDQALLIHYLLSDAAKYATGNVFRVNGGQAMAW